MRWPDGEKRVLREWRIASFGFQAREARTGVELKKVCWLEDAGGGTYPARLAAMAGLT